MCMGIVIYCYAHNMTFLHRYNIVKAMVVTNIMFKVLCYNDKCSNDLFTDMNVMVIFL